MHDPNQSNHLLKVITFERKLCKGNCVYGNEVAAHLELLEVYDIQGSDEHQNGCRSNYVQMA